MSRSNSNLRLTFRTLLVSCALLAAFSSLASAQRGGMGGGGMGGGGRGGGRGGGGGMSETPMDRVQEQLKETDELEFLDKRSKQLSLDKEQKNQIKSLNKEMEQMQKPLLKEIERTFDEASRNASQGGGGSRGGGGGEEGGGRGGPAMPSGIRESLAKLVDIQSAFADRAAVLLNDSQKKLADSLRIIYKNDLRDKAERKARAARGGGFGRGI